MTTPGHDKDAIMKR